MSHDDEETFDLIGSLPSESVKLAKQTIEHLNECLARVTAESIKQSDDQSSTQSTPLSLASHGASNQELVELEQLINQNCPFLKEQSEQANKQSEEEEQPMSTSDRVAEMMRRLGMSSAYEAARSNQSSSDEQSNNQSNNESNDASSSEPTIDQSNSQFALPPSYLAFLSQHDGQSFDSANLLGNFCLLSAKQIKTEYQNLCEMNQYDMFKTENQTIKQSNNQPSKRVQSTWYDNGWIPIAQSNFGHFICIDVNPIKQSNNQSNKGQLILYQIDSPLRPVIANSWIEFFESFIQSVNQSINQSINRFSINQTMWIGDGSEGFHGVWLEGSNEFAARKENQIAIFDENSLNQLCTE